MFSKSKYLVSIVHIDRTLFLVRNGEKSSESSGTDSDTLDKLGQGREHKNSSSSLFNSPLPFPFDYEQKKLLAMKGELKSPDLVSG